MKNLYLDPITKDLSLTSSNNLRLTENLAEYVSQKIENKLLFFLGEWWLNVDLGLPYFENFFVKNPDINYINSIFIREINSIEEIEEILEFSTIFDTSARTYKINFRVKLINDEILEGLI